MGTFNPSTSSYFAHDSVLKSAVTSLPVGLLNVIQVVSTWQLALPKEQLPQTLKNKENPLCYGCEFFGRTTVREPSEWRPFFPQLTRCHAQPKPKPKWNKAPLPMLTSRCESSASKMFYCLSFLQPKKRHITGENIRNKVSDCAKPF